MRTLPLLCLLGSVLAGCDANAPTAPSKPAEASVAADGRPNILVIVLDDAGFEHMGAFRRKPDPKLPVTPNIDALALRGMRFFECYGNPICSPSRATLITGRYSFRTGIGNIVGRNRDASLPDAEHTVAEVMNAAGYDNSFVGKWHLGHDDHIVRAGWKWSAGTDGNIVNAEEGRSEVVGREVVARESYTHWPKQVNGKRLAEMQSKYLTQDTTDDAIERAASMQAPWLLWVSYHAVHGPWHVPPAGTHRYDSEKISGVPRDESYAMMENVDAHIGRLLDSLHPDTRARTNIILLSDNAPQRWSSEGQLEVFSKDRRKGIATREGTHVPMLVCGPAIPAEQHGASSKSLTNTVDVFATIAAWAEAELPADIRTDGVDLAPLFSDPTGSVRPYAFGERFRALQEDGPPLRYTFFLYDGTYSLRYNEGNDVARYRLVRNGTRLDYRTKLSGADKEAFDRLTAHGKELLDHWPRN